MVCPGVIIGAANRKRVRSWLISHPGGTNGECASALGLSAMAVGRHVKHIRAEWLALDPLHLEQTVTDSSALEAETVCGGGPKSMAEAGKGCAHDG